MSVVAVGAIAAPIIGGMMAGDAAGDAADAQIQASERASATQEAARLQQRQDLAPWTTGGSLAQNELLMRLGLGGGSGGGAGGLTREQLRNELLGQFTKTTQPNKNIIYDSLGNYYATSQGGQGESASYYYDPEHAKGNYGGGTSIDEAGLNAAIDARMAAQTSAVNPTNPNFGSLLEPAPAYKQFTRQDLDNDLVFQNTYKTALDTGLNQINARAASGGGYGSGAALKALTRFGAQTANTYTGDAYNRNLGEQNNLYTRNMAGKQQVYDFLGGVSRQGQSAAAGVGAAGIATGNSIAGNQLAAGNAKSAGIVGGANALAGGIGDATNAYQWNQLMSKNKPSYQTPGINPYGNDYGAGMNSYLYSNAGSGG